MCAYLANIEINNGVVIVKGDNSYTPTVNTKGYFPLSIDILDYSGNNVILNDAPSVPFSGTTPTVVTGKFGGARFFDGLGTDIIYSETPIFTDVSNITMSAWIKPNAKVFGASNQGMAVNFGTITNGISFGLENEGNTTCIVGGLLPAVAWLRGDSTPLLDINNWTNIVLTRADGTIKIYNNGVKYVATWTDTPNTPTAFSIGRFIDSITSYWFRGSICEVICENVAWTDQEVLDYYLPRAY